MTYVEEKCTELRADAGGDGSGGVGVPSLVDFLQAQGALDLGSGGDGGSAANWATIFFYLRCGDLASAADHAARSGTEPELAAVAACLSALKALQDAWDDRLGPGAAAASASVSGDSSGDGGILGGWAAGGDGSLGGGGGRAGGGAGGGGGELGSAPLLAEWTAWEGCRRACRAHFDGAELEAPGERTAHAFRLAVLNLTSLAKPCVCGRPHSTAHSLTRAHHTSRMLEFLGHMRT